MKTCDFCAEQIQDAAIKCKHCGEFLDEDPEQEPEREHTDEEIYDLKRSRKVKREKKALGCMLLLPLIFAVSFVVPAMFKSCQLDMPQTKSQEQHSGGVYPTKGDLTTINKQVAAALDSQADYELASVIEAKDEERFKKMVLQGRLIILKAGTRVVVINNGGLMSSSCKVRVDGGEYEGRECLVDQACLANMTR